MERGGGAVTDRLVEHAGAILARVRARRPLIHHITNFVTAAPVADLTLALGAAPMMAHAAQEVEEATNHAQALVVNMGTLTPDAAGAMTLAGRRANLRGIPVILDPVGAGGTAFRTSAIRRLLAEVRFACVRGNSAEIGALAGQGAGIVGVDARGETGDMAPAARDLARTLGAAVAATGAIDVVADGTRTVRVANGHPLLTRITGGGCMATAAVGAAAAVEDDGLLAAAAALLWIGVAAETAAQEAAGPGTFRAALLDAVAGLDPAALRARARVSLE
jgi:hydroxyethylthiazole kinase